ncbi:Beta-galactosidase C-terminal domain [Streptomyces cyanogenus]|uniref:Beta-galactosidase C-terminal domain-containing protein n=1 Tax=Streptomyces cyanogenus TaxID=80860 RepID=A0ABX7U1C1_STRCY|nr:hypothetical protein S1361_33590 [Streptomyces cyanogenus]
MGAVVGQVEGRVRSAPPGVEVVLRRGPEADYLFVIDHTGQGASVPVAQDATELLTGTAAPGSVTVLPGDVAVVREPRGR